ARTVPSAEPWRADQALAGAPAARRGAVAPGRRYWFDDFDAAVLGNRLLLRCGPAGPGLAGRGPRGRAGAGLPPHPAVLGGAPGGGSQAAHPLTDRHLRGDGRGPVRSV